MARKALSRRSFALRVLVMTAGLAGCAAADPWPRRGYPAPAQSGETEHPPVPPPVAEEMVETLVELHNKLRAEAKLGTLSVNKKLQEAAEVHARDMASRHKMTHTGSDGSTPSSRITGRGYRMRRSGENIAFGHFTPLGVMKGWMDSPTHKLNILGSFSQIGVGYAIAEDGTPYWCVTFGLPARRK